MMPADSESPSIGPSPGRLPTLHELGRDLLHVSALRRVLTIGLPFVMMVGYVIFACLG